MARRDKTDPTRLAIVVSHPVQHFVSFYQALAARDDIELVVFYASSMGVESYFDKEMQTEIAWSMDLLGGYEHVFLPEADRIKSSAPFSVNNPSISAELDRFDPTVVLIYGYNQITMLRALWWCRRSKVPVMMIGDSVPRPLQTGLRRIAKRTLVPRILERFDCFLTVGDRNEEFYRQYGVGDERFFRSPFTIDEKRYKAARQQRPALRAQARRELGIDEKAVVALCVGKLSERKRAGDLIRAAERLNSAKVTFVLAGNGVLMDELQAVVAEKDLPVKFAGFVNVDQLPGVYACADMIVHPAERDPHPLVMSEGACVGLPIIVSDRVGATGPTDIVRAGENAIVVPCGDIDALAQAVSRLCDDEELRAAMSLRSVEIFDELDMQCSVAGVRRAIDYCLQRR
jgi:glycosyltransferase involved in cell wall biosynthesis